MTVIELELVCASIGFLFIGAMLGMVIGLNAPDVEDEEREERSPYDGNTW